jgi:flagella basal body P-ring formation protein FlgA
MHAKDGTRCISIGLAARGAKVPSAFGCGALVTCLALLLARCQAASAGGAFEDTQKSRESSAASRSEGSVRVALQTTADVSARDVCIADVATLDGGTPELRDWIGRLDLSDPPRSGQSIRVTRSQVAFRIRLAGLDDRLFALDGSRETAVSLASHDVLESEIVAAAERYVRGRLPWDEEDVVVHLAQSLRSKVVVPAAKSDVRIEAALRSQKAPIGRVRVDVAVWVKGVKQHEIPVLLDVQVFQLVAVAKRRIERGQLLSDDNVHFDRRPIDDSRDYLTAKDLPVGKRAKRPIAATQLIASVDIEAAELEKQVLIKAGDVVKLVARTGGLQLSTTGEALQEGPAGKMIRVRNVDSKAVVMGRVVDKSTVEVLR